MRYIATLFLLLGVALNASAEARPYGYSIAVDQRLHHVDHQLQEEDGDVEGGKPQRRVVKVRIYYVELERVKPDDRRHNQSYLLHARSELIAPAAQPLTN